MNLSRIRNPYEQRPTLFAARAKAASAGYLALPDLDAEQQGMFEILTRTFYLLALGALGIFAISGDFPWFLVPLGVFLFFGCCLSWRQGPRE